MADIKYLILDVDGTLTDGCVYMGDKGELCKAFNIKDGYGIVHILRPAGITPVIITGRESKIVENRCHELKITAIYQGVVDKKAKLLELLEKSGDTPANCAYMGDDLNDLECMMFIKNAGGLIGCPQDSAAELLDVVDFVSEKGGGRGCVRDFIEWLVRK